MSDMAKTIFPKKKAVRKAASKAKPKEAIAPTKIIAETKGEPRPFTITDVLLKGIENDVAEYAARDKETAGTLRGGSCGAIVEGEQYGCARLAALRYHGVSLPSDLQGQLTMKFGIGYEYFVDYFMKKSGLVDGRVKREEEIPVNYTIERSQPTIRAMKMETVTGRPDLVVMDKAGNPFWGVELKLKSTYYGAKNILLNSKVDTEHAIQALHYMFAHKLSRYSIVYGIPVRFAVQKADEEAFRATGTAITRESDGAPQYGKLGFYETIFEYNEDTDTLVSYTVHSGIERELPIRMHHIADYYKLVSAVAHRETLGARPSARSLAAPGQKEWKKCDYCALKDVCSEYEEGDVDTWWDHALQKAREEWLDKWPELGIHETF